MKYAFIAASEVAFSVAVMCRVLGVSRSGFYDSRSRPQSKRKERDAVLRPKIHAAFVASRQTYGSPRILAELRASGEAVSKKKVAKLMREDRLVAREKKRFKATTDSRHADPIAPNLVDRDFVVSEKNQTWVTDVTAIWTHAGWLFLAVMLDLYSRRVVGWATSATNDRFLALDALRSAIAKRRPPRGSVHHSDRGSPFASEDYRAELERFGFIASMSRKGDCWDNAVAESFFSTLKTELIGSRVYATHASATATVGDYIEGFYNPTRRHSYLGYQSPIEFELVNRLQVEAA